MRKIFIVAFIAIIAAFMSSCKSCADNTTQFVSEDSTELITLVGNDSLYIDCYASGCPIAAYSLKGDIYSNICYGKCWDYNEFTEEPTYITEKIVIKHVFDDRYTITFNDKETYYMRKINGYNGKEFYGIIRKIYNGTYKDRHIC
jgi:hypothetical protein